MQVVTAARNSRNVEGCVGGVNSRAPRRWHTPCATRDHYSAEGHMATDQQGDRTSQQGDGQDDTNAEQSSPSTAPDQSGGAHGAAGEDAARARTQGGSDRGGSDRGGGSKVDRRAGVEQLGDEEAGDGMGT
jgi:hypothetical protein